MTWTEKEISSYKQVKSPKLDDLYASARITRINPEERARYLAEDVLSLGMTDHNMLMRVAKKQGKHVALNILEEIAIV